MCFQEFAFDAVVDETDDLYWFEVKGNKVKVPKSQTEILIFFSNKKSGIFQIPEWLAVRKGLMKGQKEGLWV